MNLRSIADDDDDDDVDDQGDDDEDDERQLSDFNYLKCDTNHIVQSVSKSLIANYTV